VFQGNALSVISDALVAGAILAGVPLLVGTAISFVIAFLQAVTQIQDQTLPQTIKIIAIAFIFAASGHALAIPLLNATEHVFGNFEVIARNAR
jgi:type III secretion protein S